jgi:Tfp pilus assembly PilM family ATPase
MRFNWRRPLGPPIAADFGASSIRMLQLSDDGTAIAAAIESPCELDAVFNEDTHLSRAATMIETIQADVAWTGNRVVVSMPASIVSMTHLRLNPSDDLDTAIHTRIQDLGANPMVRSIDVSTPWQSGRGGREVLCIAMPRETVLRYVAMLHEHGMEVTGVYSPASMLLRAFQHVNRRTSDVDTATMYVNLEPANVTVAFGHGSALVAARRVAGSMKPTGQSPAPLADLPPPVPAHEPPTHPTDVLTALNRRQAQASPSMPAIPVAADVADSALDDLCEELRMCIRQHQSLFGQTAIGRIVFTGHGATAAGSCRAIARSLQLPAQIGDPLARWDSSTTSTHTQDWSLQIRPQWAIAAGLVAADDEADTK